MRNLAGSLEEQQAAFRHGGKQASSAPFFDEVFKIFLDFEPQKRELKSVLPPTRLGMANTNIAASFGEDRNDVIDETDPPLLRLGRLSRKDQHCDEEQASSSEIVKSSSVHAVSARGQSGSTYNLTLPCRAAETGPISA